MSFSSPPPTKKVKTSGNENDGLDGTRNAPFLSPPQGCSSSLNANGNANGNGSSPGVDMVGTANTNQQLDIQSTPININWECATCSVEVEVGPNKIKIAGKKEQIVRSLMLKEAGYDIDNPSNTKKRKNYLAWDDYFMAVSFLSAQRSKDPEVQLGACIVDEENRIVGIGYNGFPRGCSDDCLPWASKSHSHENRELHTKHPFMCHAEVNAILNKCSADVKGTRMYVAGIPDNVAAKTIIQAGISEIVYLRDPIDNNATKASRIMFQMAGVKLRQYKPSIKISSLDFSGFQKSNGSTSTNGTTRTSTCSQQENKNENELPTHNDDHDHDHDPNILEQHHELLMKEASFNPKTAAVHKRKDYLSWDDYFTAVAYLSARRSKDPNTQVGACIVDSNKCISGIGYNGFPRGCSDEHLPWARVADSELHKKYPYVVHAEVNAVLNKGSKDVKGSSLYVALFPCCECAKVIIQAGIKEVVYLSDVYHDTDSCRASRIMFQMAGVRTRRHVPSKQIIDISFEN